MKTLHRVILEMLIHRHIDPDAESTLDVGSKSRRYDSLLKKRPVAVDINPNEGKGILYGDVRDLQLNEKFDQILCFEVLEYLNYPDLLKSLDNLIGQLKPNGQLLISIPYNVANHGELTRLSKHEIQNALSFYSDNYKIKILPFGNVYSLSLDCELYKHRQKSKLRISLFPLFMKRCVFLKMGRYRISDDFYGGVFIVLRHNEG